MQCLTKVANVNTAFESGEHSTPLSQSSVTAGVFVVWSFGERQTERHIVNTGGETHRERERTETERQAATQRRMERVRRANA